MLSDVPHINQEDFMFIVGKTIRNGSNTLVLGPSGAGKTKMVMQKAMEQNCVLAYINLAVLERTDFQGLPVISGDKRTVTYATPDYLPFADKKNIDGIAAIDAQLILYNADVNLSLEDAEEAAKKSKDKNSALILSLRREKARLIREDDRATMAAALPYLSGDAFKYTLAALADMGHKDDKKIVFLFDEVDKAAPETNQVLLELLQFRSINGRKLNVQACILTGNMPDEHAHTSQISHAITKRGGTFRLDIDFTQWRNWAFDAGIHANIIGFLMEHQEWLNKPPKEDPTAYASPSPRTWENASIDLKNLENDKEFHSLSHEKAERLAKAIMASNVGDAAAIQYKAWHDVYKKLDPAVDALCNKGEFPNEKYSVQQKFVIALNASSRIFAALKPDNDKQIKAIVKNVYPWYAELMKKHMDVVHGVIRLGFGGNPDNPIKYGLAQIPEFTSVFKEIHKKFEEHTSGK